VDRSAIVFGGGIGPGNLPSAAVDMYNAFTGSKVQFTLSKSQPQTSEGFSIPQLPAPPLRIPRYDSAAAAADSGVWFAGGSTSASASQVTDDIEVVCRCASFRIKFSLFVAIFFHPLLQVNPPVPLGNFSISWYARLLSCCELM
jgi:hypothetical protein